MGGQDRADGRRQLSPLAVGQAVSKVTLSSTCISLENARIAYNELAVFRMILVFGVTVCLCQCCRYQWQA